MMDKQRAKRFSGRLAALAAAGACLFVLLSQGRALAGPAGSCDVRESLGFCYEYAGDAYRPEGMRAECAGAPGGVFRPGPCPGADVIGDCVHDPGDNTARRLVYRFYRQAFDQENAKRSCPGAYVAR